MVRKIVHRCVAALFVAFGPLLPAVSHAESYLVDEIAGWQIGVETDNAGCFAYGSYEGGLVLKFGFNPLEELLEFTVGSLNWNGIDHGKEYELKAMFGQGAPWTGTFLGGKDPSGLSFLHAATTDTQIIQAFMRKRDLTLFFEGREIAKLSLKGSYKAFEVVMACQKQVMEEFAAPRPGLRDPFAEQMPAGSFEPRSSDPLL